MRYTRELLESAAKDSISIAEMMRKMGIKNWSGGLQNWIVNRIKFFNIDTRHFLGQAHGRGKVNARKKHWSEVLITKPQNSPKTEAAKLRRAMLEAGFKYECACGLRDKWYGAKLVLQVDHINGNNSDHRKENLRFLCPNCHSQTSTFGVRNRK